METYYEVRTVAGAVVEQFTDIPVMERWFQRRNISCHPTYQVFKITKCEELYHVQPNHEATTA